MSTPRLWDIRPYRYYFTMPSILVINPNSSTEITEKLKEMADPAPDFTYKFFTAPPSCPRSIDSYTSEALSVQPCLEALLPLLEQHDAFLVAHHSNHPLVNVLREHTTRPVISSLSASILQVLAMGRGKFAVLCTDEAEKLRLEPTIFDIVPRPAEHYAGTFSADLSDDLDMLDVEQKLEPVLRRIQGTGAKNIIVGSTELFGMVGSIKAALVSEEVNITDGIIAGTEMLVGIVRTTL